jgi:hypothetical protein
MAIFCQKGFVYTNCIKSGADFSKIYDKIFRRKVLTKGRFSVRITKLRLSRTEKTSDDNAKDIEN